MGRTIPPYHQYHGTDWSRAELQTLDSLMRQGLTVQQVAMRTGRSTAACVRMFRELRRMQVLIQGQPTDTLRSFTARERRT